jgi:hypothetical protein
MPLTVEDCFDQFLLTLTTSSNETSSAASHRASIEARLRDDFDMKTMFRTGSFGAGTNIRNYSDVDYFAVIPTAKLKANSGVTLAEVAASLRARFPLTANIRVNSPGVQVPFGDGGSETVEIIPVDETGRTSLNFRQFDIPSSTGDWKFSAPESHKAYVDGINDKFAGRVKPLIRFLKAWKFYRNVPIRSFYLELRVAAYANSETAIVYGIDVRNLLTALWNDQLSDLSDPRFPNDNMLLSACTSESGRKDALSKLENSKNWAQKAVSEQHSERPGAAIALWKTLYADEFPSFGVL